MDLKAARGWNRVDDDDVLWSAFDERYRFRPGFDPSEWPAILEPAQSITFGLDVLTGKSSYDASVNAIAAETIRAFISCFPGEKLVVFDWQHPTWSLDLKTVNVLREAAGTWPVSVFPDGDYHAFFLSDLNSGVFGHPWGETFTVIGEKLVATLGATLSTWLPVVRVGGVPL